MRVLLLGAGGFIGRHILAALSERRHDVVAVVRRLGGLPEAFPEARFVEADLADMTREEEWRRHVAGIEAVLNAAGLLSGSDLEAIHFGMPRALYAACAAEKVRRAVLISAISARADVATAYSQTKLAGESALRESGVSWTILRPSLVYADGSYGGTSVMRALAAFPLVVPLPGDGHFLFSPIHAGDLARAAVIACEEPRFAGATLEPSGPETLTLDDLLVRYRAWLGFGRARFVRVPMPALRLLGRMGDVLGGGPIASASLDQMVAGNAGDGEAFAKAIGFRPRSLGEALRSRPAQVQDRWHARLFFLAPALRAMLIAMWLTSAIVGLMYGRGDTFALLSALGLPNGWAEPARIGSSLLDVVAAIWVALDQRARWSTLAQLAIVLGYTLVIGMALPALWLDPLGPLMKNGPILLAILAYGAIGDRR